MVRNGLALMMLACPFLLPAQQKPVNTVSQVWVADNGDGTYKNPVLHADYSDPDAVRVGEDYYMTASSFNAAPGLPILHSRDLVNWKLIAYALPQQVPPDVFSKPQHGNGVWAPSIRFHKGEYYIYYPDPDYGIYLIKAEHPAGPWSEPLLVAGGKGLIDPCPLWDDNGDAYLVHAYAGSRAGIKSIIVVKKMNAEGTKLLDAGRLVYDGHETDPTIEGPKFYKRNGYYYIFAPAGGVATGWQLVLRSRNVYGPYERKVVMDQGSTPINGPHQGAWVNTPTGEDWFLHFQDKGAYGRIVHLQPMRWVNNWPVIGIDKDGDGKGEPVLQYKKPSGKSQYGIITPPESDEFNTSSLGLQWQWQANPVATWSFTDALKGGLRLYSVQEPEDAKNLWDLPNLLLQKFPAETFTVTTKLSFHPSPKPLQERTGLVVLGLDYASLELQAREDGQYLLYSICENAEKKTAPKNKELIKLTSATVFLRVMVSEGGICRFSYSTDGEQFIQMDNSFTAKPGKWVGAKVGLFCSRTSTTNNAGYALIDWFRIHKNTDLK